MKFDKVLLETAKLWAEMSSCKRLKVGAVVSKNNRIISTGYNGTTAGSDNCCEDTFYLCPECDKSNENKEFFTHTKVNGSYFCPYCGNKVEPEKIKKITKTNDLTIHAEQNALIFCAKEGLATNGCDIFVTHSPCMQCAKLIAQAGIKRVIYHFDYRDSCGIDFLRGLGIEVKKL